MKNEIIKIADDLRNGAINTETARNLLLVLFSVSGCLLVNAKKGDYLKCTKVYSQSKKYTVGKTYQIINIEMIDVPHLWKKEPHIVIRDDNNKLTRINQISGISFTEFDVLSCH